MSVCVGLGKQFGRGECVCLEHGSDAMHIQNKAVKWSIFGHFLELLAVFNTRAVKDDVVSKWGACRGQVWPAGTIFLAAYRLYTVVPRLVKFVDVLTNWYVRMNRRRLKVGISCCTPALATKPWQSLGMAFMVALCKILALNAVTLCLRVAQKLTVLSPLCFVEKTNQNAQ